MRHLAGPVVEFEGVDLRDRQIGDLACAVGGAIDLRVVHEDRHAVLGPAHIGLEDLHSGCQGPVVGLPGVLPEVGRLPFAATETVCHALWDVATFGIVDAGLDSGVGGGRSDGSHTGHGQCSTKQRYAHVPQDTPARRSVTCWHRPNHPVVGYQRQPRPRTPGLRMPAGSTADLAPDSACAKTSGRCCVYHGTWSRPTAW